MYQDRNLTCKDCGNQFVFSAGEQEFFAAKQFTNAPGRCPECRANSRQQRSGHREREMFTTTCSACGRPAQVPFRPSGDKPVYCSDCFQPRSRY